MLIQILKEYLVIISENTVKVTIAAIYLSRYSSWYVISIVRVYAIQLLYYQFSQIVYIFYIYLSHFLLHIYIYIYICFQAPRFIYNNYDRIYGFTLLIQFLCYPPTTHLLRSSTLLFICIIIPLPFSLNLSNSRNKEQSVS